MRAIVQITRPEISAEERAKRLEEIKRAAAKLVLATEKQRSRQAAHRKDITA